MTQTTREKKARASLKQMLELLDPYLPKRLFPEDDPGRDWHTADRCDQCPVPDRDRKSKSEAPSP